MAVLHTNHGFLVTLEREGERSYVGTVGEDDQEYPVRFELGEDGAVTVGPLADCPAELAERARLVVRASLKQNASLELPPPRRITRWRPAK